MNVGELPIPEPGRGGVLFRVLRIGLRIDPEKGGVAAHGIAGQVERVGPGVDDIFPGERYAVQSVVGCGECEYCFQSRENLCPKAYHPHGFGEAGAYAEHFVVPPGAITQGCLIHLPEGLETDAGLFVEPLAYCMNGLNPLPIGNTTHLVVIGAGLGGILSGLVGRSRKARRVTLCDPDSRRIDFARGLPLSVDLVHGGDEAVEKILAESPGGVDAVVCAVSDPQAIRRAFKVVAIGGHLCLLVPGSTSPQAVIDPADITRRELHVHGSSGANRQDYIEARHIIAEGQIPSAQLITRRFGFAELKSAIDLLSDPTQRPVMVCLEVATEAPMPRSVEPPPIPVEGEAEPALVEADADYQNGSPFSEAEIAEMARRVREPQFDYGPGSDLGPSGEIAPWPDLPAEYLRERERERQRRLERLQGGRRRRDDRRRGGVAHGPRGRHDQRPAAHAPSGRHGRVTPEPERGEGRRRRGRRGRGGRGGRQEGAPAAAAPGAPPPQGEEVLSYEPLVHGAPEGPPHEEGYESPAPWQSEESTAGGVRASEGAAEAPARHEAGGRGRSSAEDMDRQEGSAGSGEAGPPEPSAGPAEGTAPEHAGAGAEGRAGGSATHGRARKPASRGSPRRGRGASQKKASGERPAEKASGERPARGQPARERSSGRRGAGPRQGRAASTRQPAEPKAEKPAQGQKRPSGRSRGQGGSRTRRESSEEKGTPKRSGQKSSSQSAEPDPLASWPEFWGEDEGGGPKK